MNDRSMLDALVAADRATPGPAQGTAERAWPGVEQRVSGGDVPPVSDASPALAGSAWVVPTVLATVLVCAVGAALWLALGSPEPGDGAARASAPAVVETPSTPMPAPDLEMAPTPAPDPVVAPEAIVVPVAPGGEAPAEEPKARRSPPSAGPTSAPSAPPPSELSLIRAIQKALRANDATGALRAIAEHQRRYPRGDLVQEREAGRVRALCAQGSTAKAKRVADAFAEKWPDSSHLERVRSACW